MLGICLFTFRDEDKEEPSVKGEKRVALPASVENPTLEPTFTQPRDEDACCLSFVQRLCHQIPSNTALTRFHTQGSLSKSLFNLNSATFQLLTGRPEGYE